MSIIRFACAAFLVGAAAFGGFKLSDGLLNAAPDTAGGPASASGAGAAQGTLVRVAPVEMRAFLDSVEAVGSTRARRAINLQSPVAGRVEDILFAAGHEVAPGDVLLRLDSAAAGASVKAAEATLTEARAAFERISSLSDTGSTSRAALETARAALLRAEAEHERALTILDDHAVIAPFRGHVGLTDLDVGEYIDAAQVIATLDDRTVMEVDFSVPERVLAQLAPGQAVQLTSGAYPGRAFAGQLMAVDTRVDQVTRSIALRAEVPNEDGALVGGMFMRVTLVLDQRRAPAVPEQALSVSAGGTRVFLAEGGQARLLPVETGLMQDGLIEITSEIPADAQVITSNLQQLTDGAAIRVLEPVAADAAARAGSEPRTGTRTAEAAP